MDKSQQDRTIRVFVSSTFRDMQEDRDYLVKFVFPQLRKLCEARGVTWGEVDLRWGITEEEAAEGKVLPLCLEEIHRCRPYFIGLLGERYGWVPKPEEIPDDLLEREPWLKDHLSHSVTELEIIHGVLREEQMHRRARARRRSPDLAETADRRSPGHTARSRIGRPSVGNSARSGDLRTAEQMHHRAFFYFRDPGYLDQLPEERNRADFESESPEAHRSPDLAETADRRSPRHTA